MNEPSSSEPTPALPGQIPAPPPIRPPDIISPRGVGPTYQVGNSSETNGIRDRSHPTDAYPPLKKKKGGCCGCVGSATLALTSLFIVLVGAVAYFGPGRFVAKGYTVVRLETAETMISVPPDVATLYIGQMITYKPPVTTVPVAILAQEMIVSGDFHDEVSLNGIKVTALSTARFAKNLEVYAAEFFDKGITLKGELDGLVMRSGH